MIIKILDKTGNSMVFPWENDERKLGFEFVHSLTLASLSDLGSSSQNQEI